MADATTKIPGAIDPYALCESEIKDMIDDLKERCVQPNYKFETWGEQAFYIDYIHAWLLPDIGIEVYEVGSSADYPSPGADTIGVNREFDGWNAVELFIRCGVFQGDKSDPVLVANILGAEAIQAAKPDDPGPVILLGVTDYNDGGQTVRRLGDDGDDPDYQYESYGDAQAAIDAFDNENDLVFLGHNECAYWHKIVPAQ